MQRRPIAVGLVVAALAAFSFPARAADEPDELIPGKIHIIKPGKLVKMVAKPAGAFTLPGAGNDPTIEGGSLRIRDLGGTGGDNTYALPAAGWKGLGNPPGSKGFKYKGAGASGDPCKVVLVKSTVIKFVCKGADVTLTPPFDGPSSIVLTLGTDSKQYCAEFGGTQVKNQDGLLKRKGAPAPGACPATAPPTTTTTTLPVGSCCNGETYLAFQVGIGAGDCGDVVRTNGTNFSEVACGGLYFGGGGNSVPLPAQVPDTGQYITKITGCLAGEGAVLGPATAVDTGSVENCTGLGCFFGAPLPIPNATTPPTSTCVVNNVAVDAVGTADCAAGTTDLALPLTSTIYLTGDLLPAITGIQPCPLCLADGSSSTGFRCTGTGVMPTEPECTPDTSPLGDAFPTSYDCPPPANLNIGAIPIDYALTTGTVSYTAAPGPGSSQQRVFCGFCRDADDTGAFESPAKLCFENGTAETGCGGVYESCEQRTQGAFGPNGGGVQTITVVGSPAGNLLDSAPHPSVLGSIFCIPPTFNATVDAAGDLPGPGAAALQGTAELRTTP